MNNAPPFEMVGIGFLAIGFLLIGLFMVGACIVFGIKEVITKCRK
jgi:hypothetical protein